MGDILLVEGNNELNIWLQPILEGEIPVKYPPYSELGGAEAATGYSVSLAIPTVWYSMSKTPSEWFAELRARASERGWPELLDNIIVLTYYWWGKGYRFPIPPEYAGTGIPLPS